MRSVLAPSLIIASAIVAGPAMAKKVWKPKPVFTVALCNEELASATGALTKKLQDAAIAVPAKDSRDAKLNGAYTEFLVQTDRATRARARAQARHAGKWKGRTRYKVLKWQGRKYLITSCQLAKPRIPLSKALRIVEGIKEPSSVDEKIAGIVRNYVKVKNARRICRSLRPFRKARRCLAKYPDLDWLDRYPM